MYFVNSMHPFVKITMFLISIIWKLYLWIVPVIIILIMRVRAACMDKWSVNKLSTDHIVFQTWITDSIMWLLCVKTSTVRDIASLYGKSYITDAY